MRRLRNAIQAAIPIAGAVIIFMALIFISDANPQTRLLVVLFGILVIEAGIWKLTNPFLPSERKYLGLREEVDGFIHLVRALNRTSLAARASGDDDDAKAVGEVLTEMHASVDYMAELAGKTDEELAAEKAAAEEGAEAHGDPDPQPREKAP